MTTATQHIQDAADNAYFKLISRGAMVFSTVILLPALGFIAIRSYDAVARIERAQATQDTHMQLMDLAATNDRSVVHTLNDETQKRIDLVFLRINMLPTKSDVDKDLLLRDQRIDALDRRLGALELRINGLNNGH